MSIISYAQNFEDVMLWRSLKHVKKGFYIDIGAQDPVKDSVSLAFYEQGWRGIHVEPTRQYSQMLREARPDETVLQMAVGLGETLTLFEFKDTGLSTGDPEVAQRHKDAGFQCTETNVEVLSLDDLLEQVETEDVHWMKIDVEGFEKSVLQSWKLSLKRPWVVIIESTKPMTSESNHHQWESEILKKGYSFAYFDGLNRFYVSSEHSDLKKSFLIPPNLFDGFILSGIASNPFCQLVLEEAKYNAVKLEEVEAKVKLVESQAERAETEMERAEIRAEQAFAKVNQTEVKLEQVETKLQEAEAKLQQTEVRAEQAEIRADESEARIYYLDSLLTTVYNSRSWRITEPLRKITTVIYWLVSGIDAWVRLKPGSRPRRVAKFSLLKMKAYVVSRPKLKAQVVSFLGRYPRIKDFFRKLVFNDAVINVQQPIDFISASVNPELENLTQRERKIFHDLQNAILKRKGSL